MNSYSFVLVSVFFFFSHSFRVYVRTTRKSVRLGPARPVVGATRNDAIISPRQRVPCRRSRGRRSFERRRPDEVDARGRGTKEDGVGFFDYVSTVDGGDVFAVVRSARRGKLISQSKIGLKIAPTAKHGHYSLKLLAGVYE